MHKFRFAVYEHVIVYDGSKKLTRQFIVVKDADGNIVRWTDFHEYAKSGTKSLVKSVYSDSGARCYNVVQLLNYVFWGKYNIDKLSDITVDMVKDFLNDYGLCTLPDDDEDTHRSKSTVKICVSHILDFIDLFVCDYPDCSIKVDKLFRTIEVFSKKQKRYIKKRVPVFEVNYKSSNKSIFRDLPEGPFQIIMNQIVLKHTDILMLAACSAFAGMRPSECCNVRRADSLLGTGIRFHIVDGVVEDVFIDLTEELVLRSDLVDVGGIKKPRTQKVYHAFLEAFVSCYNTYMAYIAGKPYEAEYGALSVTSTGKATTYRNYYNEFQHVVEECIPIMLASDDAKTQNYGLLLQENRISPHILRHWFSAKITLYGEDVAGIMNWRGDTSPESALTYLMNKSELEKEYEHVSDEVINYSLWRAEKIIGGSVSD